MLGVWRRLLNTLRSTNHTAHTHTNTSTHVSHIGLFGSEILFRKNLDCERRSGSGSCCLCHSEQLCYCDCCCGLSLTARRDSLLASHVFFCPRFVLVIRCAQETRDAAFRCCSGSVASLQQKCSTCCRSLTAPRSCSRCVCFRLLSLSSRIMRELFVEFLR